MGDKGIPTLQFSSKYTAEHSLHYLNKHDQTWGRRISNWREQAMAARALRIAGEPASVLDMPCGAGRFWEMLARTPGRRLVASDNSWDMVNTARLHRPAEVARRFEWFQGSAFAIPLRDGAVECAFCIRLLHHIGQPEDRMIILRELARVAQQTVIVSLWIDGNLKAISRRRAEAGRTRGTPNRFLIPRATVEAEFAAAGLEVVGRVDMLKLYSMWAMYVLRKRGG